MSKPVGYMADISSIGAKPTDSITDKISDAFKNTLDAVNSAENNANELNAALQRGEDIPIHEAMLSMQKATLSFQVMNAARNKLVQAYQTVSNMNI
jgi:flagellar hook-basal body complex protein FliE